MPTKPTTPTTHLDGLQKNIRVRRLRLDDYEELVAIQQRCFPGMDSWRREQLASQISHFPDGQLCVELDGRIVGSASSLIIDFDEYSEIHSWTEISDSGYITNHDPEGDTLYGIEVMVEPDLHGMKIGRRLYEARQELARTYNLKRIVIGGRVPEYHGHADELTIHEYVEEVMAKRIYDPVLTFQLANGFTLKRILPEYLGSDAESRGYALLLEWVNLRYAPNPAERHRSTFPVRVCTVQYQLRRISSFGDLAHQCEYFVDVASGYKSDFVVFPEIFTLQLLSFLPQERPEESIRRLTAFTGEYLELFQRLAIRYAVNIIGGSHYTEDGEEVFNTAYLFRRDGSIDLQRKLHITPNEQRWWGIQAGDALQVFDTDRGRVGILVCYDVEFPELARLAAERGARILFVPFCTDTRQGYLRVRYCAQARAVENQLFVVTSGCVGNLPSVDNLDINYAQSGIFTPSDFPFSRDGIAGECQANIETVVFADLDLEVLRRNRQEGTVRTWGDRRTDLYEVRWLGPDQDREPALPAEAPARADGGGS